MTAGRKMVALCSCGNYATFVTTGLDFGPMVMPEKHNRPDGTECNAGSSPRFEKSDGKLEPMPMPVTKLLDLSLPRADEGRIRVLFGYMQRMEGFEGGNAGLFDTGGSLTIERNDIPTAVHALFKFLRAKDRSALAEELKALYP